MTKNWRRSYKWRKTRKKRIIKDKNRCVVCGTTEHLEVHHVEDASYHPELIFKMSNLRTVCRGCHSHFHNDYKKSFRKT